MRSRFYVIAILCLASACSAKGDGNASAAKEEHRATSARPTTSAPEDDNRTRTIPTPAVRMGTWYQAGAFRVRSLVAGVLIAPTADLPVIIREKQDDAYCPDKPKAETPEGRWAVARGWRISSERKLGQLVAVNVVRHLEHDVGGLCISIDGQFLLFDHGRPIASVMTVSEYGYQLGFLSETERGGFRIESGLKEPPFGDLFVKGDDIDIEPLPPSETWCDGKKPVPNIFGKPIQEARKILRRAGWKPVPRYRRLPAIGDDGKGDIFSGEDYLYHDGVTEVVGCEPRGQCWLDYRSGQATAEILTQGEHVTNYGVDCDDRRSEARAGT